MHQRLSLPNVTVAKLLHSVKIGTSDVSILTILIIKQIGIGFNLSIIYFMKYISGICVCIFFGYVLYKFYNTVNINLCLLVFPYGIRHESRNCFGILNGSIKNHLLELLQCIVFNLNILSFI